MGVSIGATTYSWPRARPAIGGQYAWTVRAADEAGLDTVSLVDRLIPANRTAGPANSDRPRSRRRPEPPR
jgi:hypothetical protein